MRITGEWLATRATQRVLHLLTEAGFEGYAVGGCVRNALIGMPVTDVDIATNARPETVMALAEDAGLRAVPTGLDHGTVTIVADGEGFEITTFRRDVETHGRHATIAFADDMHEDAARRDFTMNALYACADGTVLDPLGGGLADLAARRVRFVGDATARIREDYLRILRFFRFHAQYGDPVAGIDPEALAACAAGADGMDKLSAERITAELRRLLAAPDPAPAVAAMAQAGVLGHILPGSDHRALAVLVHLESELVPEWLQRLVVLGGSLEKLRLTRNEARDLKRLRAAIETQQDPAELGYRLGAELGASALLARAALLGSPLPDHWQADLRRGAAAEFPVRARDLPHLSGPDLGAELRRLEARWITSDFRLDKATLLG